TPENYWKANLPNSPIPPFLQDLLSDHRLAAGESVPGEPHRTTTWLPGGKTVTKTWLPAGKLTTTDSSDRESQMSLIFIEKDLRVGKLMNLNFWKPSDMAHFLPRHLADSIPFSSNNLPQILHKFSLNPHSVESQVLKATLQECEAKPVEGEENFCATSLESMVDYSLSKLGKGAIPLSTNADEPRLREYRVTGVKRRSSDAKGSLVACHALPYAYAVFFCHETTTAAAYEVDLTATDDGSETGAVAVCHLDTAAWSSDHVAFRVLGVKPGEATVCHFLEQGNVVWVPAK
ncbi:hypothetical protein M569_12801, partial [Genlisea aurea]